jgi:hypothetical protein
MVTTVTLPYDEQSKIGTAQSNLGVRALFRGLLTVCLVIGAAGICAAQVAGSGAPVVAEDRAPAATPEMWSIARIREALAHEPVLLIRQPTFRIGTTERRPSWFDLAADRKPLAEPPIWNAGWHNEFLTMVTPPEFRMWQAFTNTDLLQISATSLAGALAGKAIGAVSDWRRNVREAEARDEVDRALGEFLASQAGAAPEIVSRR